VPPRGRRLELVVLAGGLGFIALTGAAASALAASFSPIKVLFFMVALLAGAIAASGLQHGITLLAGALAFPVATQILFGVDLHAVHLLIGLVVVMGLIGMSLHARPAPAAFVTPCAVMIVSATAAAFAGPEPGPSLFREANGLVLVLLVGVVIAATFEPERDLLPLVWAMVAGLAGTSVVALGQKLGVTPAALVPIQYAGGRINGMFGHPNDLGGFIVAQILLLTGIAASAWRRLPFAPLVILPALGLGLSALIATQSRGALLALIAGTAVVMVLLSARRQAMAVVGILLILGLALLVIIPSVPSTERTQFTQRLQQLSQPNAEQGRRGVYRAAFAEIGKHPITGVGVFEFQRIINTDPPVPGLEFGLGHAHNIILEGWLSLGLLGLLAFAYLWGAGARRLWRATRTRPGEDPLIAAWAIGALGALASMFVQGMTDVLFNAIEIFTLFILLLATGFAFERRRNESARP
jgi:O-antigen ligase